MLEVTEKQKRIESKQGRNPDLGRLLTRVAGKVLVGLVVANLLLSACGGPNMPTQGLQHQTPVSTIILNEPPPTPEIEPYYYDDIPRIVVHPGMETELYDQAIADYCVELKEFQETSRSTESADSVRLSHKVAEVLGDDVSIVHEAVAEYNEVIPDSCRIGHMRGGVYFSLPPVGEDDPLTMAYVETHGTQCSDVDPTVIVYPSKIEEFGADFKNVTIHELAHSCPRKPITTNVTVNYVSRVWDAESIELQTPDITEYTTQGFYVAWNDKSGDFQVSGVLEEIFAEMVTLLTIMKDNPEFIEHSNFLEIEEIEGLVYWPDLVALHQSLLINGFLISPHDLAYLFVSHADHPNPLWDIAQIIDLYHDETISSKESIEAMGVLLSFAAVNQRSGTEAQSENGDRLAEELFRDAWIENYPYADLANISLP